MPSGCASSRGLPPPRRSTSRPRRPAPRRASMMTRSATCAASRRRASGNASMRPRSRAPKRGTSCSRRSSAGPARARSTSQSSAPFWPAGSGMGTGGHRARIRSRLVSPEPRATGNAVCRSDDRRSAAGGLAAGSPLFARRALPAPGVCLQQIGAGVEFTDDLLQGAHLQWAEQQRLDGRLRPGLGAARGNHGAGDLHLLDTLLAQDLLHPFDGVAGALQEITDPPQQLDVSGAVEAQHVLFDAEFLGDFTNIAKCLVCLWHDQPPLKWARKALFGRPAPEQSGVDAILHNIAWAEHQHTPRRDRHLLARLWVAPNALTLLTDTKRTEGGEFDRVSPRQGAGNLLENELNQLLGFIAR